jgi:hypothetical protein
MTKLVLITTMSLDGFFDRGFHRLPDGVGDAPLLARRKTWRCVTSRTGGRTGLAVAATSSTGSHDAGRI